MDGFLNLLKPVGMTSHDVVSYARRVLRTKKIGHTGTLDPDVAGVLLLCVGKATRLVEYILASGKTYRAEIQLGTVTDTQDISGTIIAQKARVAVSRAELEHCLQQYVGTIKQIPPMYSAVKQQGKKLYELARQGITVERPAREVTIQSLELLAYDGEGSKKAVFDVACSKGTYIRTLCHDIGQTLGCGACMSYLIRTSVGAFSLAQAWTLEEVAALSDPADALLPFAPAVLPMNTITVGTEGEKLLGYGRYLDNTHVLQENLIAEGEKEFMIVNRGGDLLAIARYENGQWQPRKVFC